MAKRTICPFSKEPGGDSRSASKTRLASVRSLLEMKGKGKISLKVREISFVLLESESVLSNNEIQNLGEMRESFAMCLSVGALNWR